MSPKTALVDVMRGVQPGFIPTHSREDARNPDHPNATRITPECRSTAQAWGHNPGKRGLRIEPVHLLEPCQPEQCGWRLYAILETSEVGPQKPEVIKCLPDQRPPRDYHTNVAEIRANQFRRNSGGQAGGRDATHAEGFMSIFPRTVDSL